MSRFAYAVSAFAVLTACGIPPLGVTAADLSAYDEAVASIGCTMATEGDYNAVAFQTGIEREKLAQIATFKLANKQAEQLENGAIKLTTGACA